MKKFFCLRFHKSTTIPHPPTQIVTELMKSLKCKYEKSQSAVEFVIIFGAIMFFFVLFMSAIQNNVNQKNVEKINILAEHIALSVQNEIALATGASNGYYREFEVPNNILGKQYEIQLVGKSVFISGDDLGISYSVFDVTGDVQKGLNVIRKENGVVYLN